MTPSESAKGVDTHEDLFGAMLAFLKLTLLFHSGSPWTQEKLKEWMTIQEPILKLQTRKAEELRRGWKNDVTTKRLCDLGRAILG